MSHISQICLRNQNSAFSLRLVNVLSAEEIFCPMSYWHDTSYCQICCSPIKIGRARRSIHSLCSLLRWCLDSLLNGQPPKLLLMLRGGRRGISPLSRGSSSSCPTPHRSHTVTSLPTGLPIPHSIPRECCSGACFSSMGTRPSTCLMDSTPLVTINLWWNSVPYGGVGPSP